MRTLFQIGLLGILISGCTNNSEDSVEETKRFFIPENFPAPLYDLSADFSSDKFNLGKQLFFDPILSEDNTISCSSCHLPQAAFSDSGNPLSKGINDSLAKRNSPALFNLAWQPAFMWDGGVNHIEVQPLAPLTNHLEMGTSLTPIIAALNRNEEYKMAFKKTFATDSITSAFLFKALSHYMACLISSDSKYDRFSRGKIKFSKSESTGLEVFEKNCSACHAAPLFTDFSYRNNGIGWIVSAPDAGRYIISQEGADSLKFKVPSLRNIEMTFPYMHDGRLKTLEEVIDHYSSGKFHPGSDTLLKNISLSSSEKKDLLNFLRTLTDKNFLKNPHLKP